MNQTSLAIINSKAPYSVADGKEALDMALIFGSYEQQVALFFIGDGVWQLVEHTDGSVLNIKDYLKTLDALAFYDVEQIYVCQQSLSERNIQSIKSLDNIKVLASEELTQQLHLFAHILRF